MVHNRSGFALPAALLCIVLIAAMAAGAMFSSGQEARATSAAMSDQQAGAYAELAAITAIGSWGCGTCDSLPPGGVYSESRAADSPFQSTVTYTRLDSSLFIVTGRARISVAGVSRFERSIAITVLVHRDSLGRARASPLRRHSWFTVYGM